MFEQLFKHKNKKIRFSLIFKEKYISVRDLHTQFQRVCRKHSQDLREGYNFLTKKQKGKRLTYFTTSKYKPSVLKKIQKNIDKR